MKLYAISDLHLQCNTHTSSLRQGQSEILTTIGGVQKDLGRVVDESLKR